MGFSKKFVSEARREIARLVTERHEIDERITFLERFVGKGSDEGKRPAIIASKRERPQGGVLKTGLREAILAVLTEHPGLHPMEVAKALLEKGFQEARTPMPIRVRNEMWRMRRDGILRRKGGRYYPRAKQEGSR